MYDLMYDGERDARAVAHADGLRCASSDALTSAADSATADGESTTIEGRVEDETIGRGDELAMSIVDAAVVTAGEAAAAIDGIVEVEVELFTSRCCSCSASRDSSTS